jgi:hypothetical protein
LHIHGHLASWRHWEPPPERTFEPPHEFEQGRTR